MIELYRVRVYRHKQQEPLLFKVKAFSAMDAVSDTVRKVGVHNIKRFRVGLEWL